MFKATNGGWAMCSFGISARFCIVPHRGITTSPADYRASVSHFRPKMGLTPCARVFEYRTVPLTGFRPIAEKTYLDSLFFVCPKSQAYQRIPKKIHYIYLPPFHLKIDPTLNGPVANPNEIFDPINVAESGLADNRCPQFALYHIWICRKNAKNRDQWQ